MKANDERSFPNDRAQSPGPALPKTPAAAFDRGAPIFVWTVWGAMVLVTLTFVRTYGTNVPQSDEWCIVPYLTGAKTIDGAWLWDQHNEHRIPLPKLILAGL